MRQLFFQEPIQWEISTPVLSSPFFITDMAKFIFFSFLLSAVMLGIIAFIADGIDKYLSLLLVVFLIFAVFAMLIPVIILLIFGNRTHYRYEVTGHGVRQITLNKPAGLAIFFLKIAAVFSSKPAACGQATLAQESVNTFIAWSRVSNFRFNDSHQVITLRSWRTLLRLYCNKVIYIKLKNDLSGINHLK